MHKAKAKAEHCKFLSDCMMYHCFLSSCDLSLKETETKLNEL